MAAAVYETRPTHQRYPHQYAPSSARAHPAPAPPAPEPPKASTSQEKFVPPEPPIRIVDAEGGRVYTRVGFLGEGGFARVYEVQDPAGKRKAIKVVYKASISSRKNKTKLWAEIKLHQMLTHPNVVRFEDCFEDDENVYMLLELCDNGSLMDLLKRRKRYTEAEARVLLVQIIGACQYMHKTNVIHRDLKLGNLFLDRNMDVKVGDFGLAALIEKPGDRKKTICGTPNYIAPEVLFDTANGHSFEVDVWSVGVILYTLIIGRPPFQTKDVKAIYKRIKENRYEFPADKPISGAAQHLIMSILNPDPDARPTLDAILKHKWFVSGEFPSRIPITAMDTQPVFRDLSASQSRRNFQDVCQKAKIGVELPINTETARTRTALGPSILQQERDFRSAIQPDSPVSALLKSAKQPLVQAPAQIKESSLLRKLTAAGAHATLSPARRGKENAPGPSGRRMDMVSEGEEEEEEILRDEPDGYEAGIRQRELANQKARIVSQMTGRERHQVHADKPSPRKPAAPPVGLSPAKRVPAHPSQEGRRPQPPQDDTRRKMGLFETVENNLDLAFKKGQDFRSPNIEPDPKAPAVFVASWLDYCMKYGMGFAMSDGTISVHFNDSDSLVLAPGKQHFDHISPGSSDEAANEHQENYSIERYPLELKNKVFLLRHFEGYILERLLGQHEWAYNDVDLTKGMVYIKKYLRMKHVILFRLSNDILQFNFYDHTKLILSRDGLVVTVIDKHYVLRTWSLEELLQPPADDIASKDRRRLEVVVHKVQYARDVLAKIRSHAIAAAQKEAVQVNIPVSREGRDTREMRETRETREARPTEYRREMRDIKPIR